MGLGQLEGRSSMGQLLNFSPSLQQQQLQQQLAASKQGMESLQRRLDISKLVGGGGGGLQGQAGAVDSAQLQAALASSLEASQQLSENQFNAKTNNNNNV